MLLQRKKGYTLIELILYIGIIAIILTTLIQFAWNIINTGVKSSVKQETSSQVKYLSERIKYEIRNALDINADSDFNINLATNADKRLSLKVAPPNDPTYIDVSGGKVRITQGANPAVSLNSNDTSVTDLTFKNYSSSDGKTKHIGFVLTIQYLSGNSRQEYRDEISLESSAELRSN